MPDDTEDTPLTIAAELIAAAGDLLDAIEPAPMTRRVKVDTPNERAALAQLQISMAQGLALVSIADSLATLVGDRDDDDDDGPPDHSHAGGRDKRDPGV